MDTGHGRDRKKKEMRTSDTQHKGRKKDVECEEKLCVKLLTLIRSYISVVIRHFGYSTAHTDVYEQYVYYINMSELCVFADGRNCMYWLLSSRLFT